LAAVFAEGTEEHAVEDPLRESDERGPGHARIVGDEPAKHIEPHAGVGIVTRPRELAAHALRLGQQSGKVADARLGHDAVGAEQKHEPLQQSLVAGHGLGVEGLVAVLIG
jgi:hypothetical protein